MEERKIVVPGETIMQGSDFLPGDGTRRENNDVVASRYGLVDISGRLVKVIALSGVYKPRKGNAIIGQVADITFNGWVIDFGSALRGFLPLSEVAKYVNKGELKECFDFDDMLIARVIDVKDRGVDLSTKLRGFGKLGKGMVIKVNANKVPRVIGKEGSMVNMVKDSTGCNIKVGQNGIIWVSGENIEDEIKTMRIIKFICENSFIEGLTDKVKEFLEKQNG